MIQSFLRVRHGDTTPIVLAAEGASAVLAIYAALLEPDIAALTLRELPASHMDDSAPALLNVLRVCDVPDALGMPAPRPVTIIGQRDSAAGKGQAIYRAAGAPDKLVVTGP
jgi:hypothetical protein